MPFPFARDAHQWRANEIIDGPTLLDGMPYGHLGQDRMTSNTTGTSFGSGLLFATFKYDTNRCVKISVRGQVTGSVVTDLIIATLYVDGSAIMDWWHYVNVINFKATVTMSETIFPGPAGTSTAVVDFARTGTGDMTVWGGLKVVVEDIGSMNGVYTP